MEKRPQLSAEPTETRNPLGMAQKLRQPERHQRRIDLPARSNGYRRASQAHLDGKTGLSFTYAGTDSDDDTPAASANVSLNGKISVNAVSDRDTIDPAAVRTDALAILNDKRFIAGERARLAPLGLNADTIATMIKREIGSPVTEPTNQPQ